MNYCFKDMVLYLLDSIIRVVRLLQGLIQYLYIYQNDNFRKRNHLILLVNAMAQKTVGIYFSNWQY